MSEKLWKINKYLKDFFYEDEKKWKILIRILKRKCFAFVKEKYNEKGSI